MGIQGDGGVGQQRVTFLVDPDGIIRFVYVTDGLVGCNPQEVLRKYGLSAEPIQSAARIAAVIHIVAMALEQADVVGRFRSDGVALIEATQTTTVSVGRFFLRADVTLPCLLALCRKSCAT